ncbi:unnamed protein product [Microthlaspi erraticum]|uniref:Uncharacterized protein n=1 Tax=Microthlaspi erraticum TaxID=1685480 RepID=A0A6D2HVL6_9BRAS|nr:unnamed protein product [Microthlaspi erraticum]
MDFIKTSSLRALIELTFQRNWNGLIWMSRKGVTTKRVKTGPDGSIENQRPNRADRLAEKRCFTLGQNHIRPSEVSAKVQTFGRYASRPGKHVPRSATPQPLTPCATTMPREPGNKPRGRATCLVPRPMRRPSRETTSRVRPRNHRPIFTVRPQRPTTNRPATTVPIVLGAAMTRSSGRSSRPTVPTPRSTRSPF